jgi:CDP-paratose 2-epimerase
MTVYGFDSLIRPGSEGNRNQLIRLGVKLIHGDIRNQSDVDNLPVIDWVVDCSAAPSVTAGTDGSLSSRQLFEHNLLGTVNILEYCKRNSAGFLMLSSSRVYSVKQLADLAVVPDGEAFCLDERQKFPAGISPAGITEQFSTSPPLSLYGASKLASEVIALEYGETFGFPVWINRCGVLAGAGQFGRTDQGIFSFWINSWLRHRPLTYHGYGGNGHQVRDCLHPRDLVPLILKQMTAEAAQQRVFNLGGGIERALSLAELSNWCRSRFGEAPLSGIPQTHRFDVPWIVMDSSFARTVWDWQPQTTLDEILTEIACHAEQNPQWLELSGMS